MSNNDNREVEAIGWNAIDGALDKLYKDVEPRHVALLIPYMLGGEEPLDGISAYKRMEPVPHWHYITYGFSELYEKEFKDPEYSGYGFELTFRVKSDADEPPVWAFNFLNNLAKYIFSTGNHFANGHYINANGPIALDADTELKAAAFVYDPELPEIDTPNGKVEFLQVVGIALDEELAIKSWNCSKVMKLFENYLPLYITDLERKSLMNSTSIQKAVEEGIKVDGSNTASLSTKQLNWDADKKLFGKTSYKIYLGAIIARDFIKVMPGRFPKGTELSIIGSDKVLTFKPGNGNEVKCTKHEFIITINNDAYKELMKNLKVEECEFKLNSIEGLTIKIDRTEIRDYKGDVIEVIG